MVVGNKILVHRFILTVKTYLVTCLLFEVTLEGTPINQKRVHIRQQHIIAPKFEIGHKVSFPTNQTAFKESRSLDTRISREKREGVFHIHCVHKCTALQGWVGGWCIGMMNVESPLPDKRYIRWIGKSSFK